MRRLCLLICIAAWLPHQAGAEESPDVRRLFDEGKNAYQTGDFMKAASAFDAAAQGAKIANLDTAVARYNEGNSLLRDHKPVEASSVYGEALRSSDLALQARGYYNRGNALMETASQGEATNALDMASRAVDEALTMYERSMTLDPRDKDPKINYELATIKKMQLEQLKQQQQQQDQSKKDQDQKDQQKQDDQSKEEQKPPEQQQDQKNPDQQKDKPQDSQQGDQQPEQSPEDQQQPSAQAPRPAGEMTPEEAKQVLDAMKQKEEADREQVRLSKGQPVPVDKDW